MIRIVSDKGNEIRKRLSYQDQPAADLVVVSKKATLNKVRGATYRQLT